MSGGDGQERGEERRRTDLSEAFGHRAIVQLSCGPTASPACRSLALPAAAPPAAPLWHQETPEQLSGDQVTLQVRFHTRVSPPRVPAVSELETLVHLLPPPCPR